MLFVPKVKTLATRGMKTIHVRKTLIDTKRATAALIGLAAGDWLKLVIISKGIPKDLIAWTELKTFDPSAVASHHY